jgi:hypothetical protein
VLEYWVAEGWIAIKILFTLAMTFERLLLFGKEG